MCVLLLKEICIKSEANLIEEKIEFPIKNYQDLVSKSVQKLSQALDKDEKEKHIKFVIVDHVPSNQPFLMPIRELANTIQLKRSDIVFIVDGAHSIGSIKSLDLRSLGADVFLTNCHKWFCGPKGTALLYQSRTLVISKLNAIHFIYI